MHLLMQWQGCLFRDGRGPLPLKVKLLLSPRWWQLHMAPVASPTLNCFRRGGLAPG